MPAPAGSGTGFRGRKITAPLREPEDPPGRRRESRCFRGRKITAPLRDTLSDSAYHSSIKFPWSEDHGSIEGWATRCWSSTAREFPWSEDHGSIEANCASVIAGGRVASFRGRKITAPLRRISAPGEPSTENAFPWSEDHGSIEAMPTRWSLRSSCPFPWSEDHGSIEAPSPRTT